MLTINKFKTSIFLVFCSFIFGTSLTHTLQAAGQAYQVPTLDEAKQFVENLITEGMQIANNPNAGEDEFGDLLARKAVIQEIARFILGTHARQLSPDQLREFTELYKKRLVKIYSTPEKLKTFRGTTHKMDQNASVEADQSILVKTLFYFNDSPNGEPAKVYWKIVKKGGVLYVLDIQFEGISKLLTERKDYDAAFTHPTKGNNDASQFLDYMRRQVDSGSEKGRSAIPKDYSQSSENMKRSVQPGTTKGESAAAAA